jgi:hypothetical protein
MEKFYNLLIIFNLITLLILLTSINLIIYSIIFEFIDIKIITNNIINQIQNFIDSDSIYKIFNIIINIVNKIIPQINRFFNATV